MTEFLLLTIVVILSVLLSQLFRSIIPALKTIATQPSRQDSNESLISNCSIRLTIRSVETDDERLQLTMRGLGTSILLREVLLEVQQKDPKTEEPRSYFSGTLDIQAFEDSTAEQKAQRKLNIRLRPFSDDNSFSAKLYCSPQEYALLKGVVQRHPQFGLSAWESVASKSEWTVDTIIIANDVELHQPPSISSEVSVIRLREDFESLDEAERLRIANSDVGKWLEP